MMIQVAWNLKALPAISIGWGDGANMGASG